MALLMENKCRIVVTGSSGFIGSYLCTELEVQGFEVVRMGREYVMTECDRVYHLGCPSSTEAIQHDPSGIADTIIDKTREAIRICPEAIFINASTMGVEIGSDDYAQNLYNRAKGLMEEYLVGTIPNERLYNYRIPSVYGQGMDMSGFIGRCVEGKAYRPENGNDKYIIISVNELVKSMVGLEEIKGECTTLGGVYEEFGIKGRKISE